MSQEKPAQSSVENMAESILDSETPGTSGWLSDGGRFSLAIAVMALVIGASGLSMAVIGLPSPQEPTIFVIDSQKIVEIKLKSLQASSVTPEMIRKEGADFVARLDAFTKEQSAAGRTIINRNAVISWPDGADITAEAAKALGVDLNAPTLAPAAPNVSRSSAAPAPSSAVSPEVLPEIQVPQEQ